MIVHCHLVMIKWASINDLCMALKKKGSEERFILEERNAITMISKRKEAEESRVFAPSECKVSHIGACSWLSPALFSLAPHDINIQHGSSLEPSILLHHISLSTSSPYSQPTISVAHIIQPTCTPSF